ncbi:right-handed parallel beta-helix repeat-containing protein [Dyadobacter sp. LHD-138]|uniref:right-handed parallel beta-helix repeat-containing protein n=1 Tax=Dyadobacter sp. LHD-138 TaxID=3071413 RepID=UPI0027E00D2D|nr:right-handed parallel beta-helix repeat-containing protein [Dyadobacter sp. LHD-138]MDQ6479291.1 DUF1565 domain-containing protein [Dyadobacter sp. LHD-138]
MFHLFFTTTFSTGTFAARFYVKPGGTGSGISWSAASSNLQTVINGASSGDEVWVAGGTYQLAAGQSFAMKEGVKIYGGFAGTEVNLADRNLMITANKSILQGNGSSVITNNNNLLTNAALLDGFTITGASNTAGIANTSCSPKLVNLIISGNTAGGISNEIASPVLIKCYIRDNTAPQFGGGMINTNSSPILTYCAITGNSTQQGGGIYNSASSPILTNCTIGGNTGTGGMNNASNSLPKLRNSIISGNKSVVGNSSNIRNDFTSATAVKYSLVQNSLVPGDDTSNPNDFNIPGDASALFVDPAGGDYRLQLCSFGLNKGSNTYFASGQTPDLSALTTDLDGNPQFYNDGVTDMGAYEYQGNPPTGIAGVSFVKVGGTGSGANWGCAAGNLQVAITSASSGEQVWVGGGTYQQARDKSFIMKEGVKIYGNFKGTELTLADRDLKSTADKSIMQGNNAMVIRNEGLNLTTASLLDGFTVTGSVFGPAIVNISSSPMLANLIITGNNAAGAVSNQGSSPVLINCAIIGNGSTGNGIGVYNSASSPVLINCTIAGNTGLSSAVGAIYNAGNSSPELRNCIVTNNKRGTLSLGIFSEAGSTTIMKYSLVYGENNLNPNDHNFPGDADPLFVDAAGGNYRVQLCSPAVNGGSKTYYASGQTPDVSAFTTDLDGNLRFFSNGAVDMGAYEYQGDPLAGVADIWYVKAGGTGSGKSWDCPMGSLEIALNVSKSGEQIWVAGGTYQPTRNASFSLKEGVKIYGNFKGTELTFADRDLSKTANKSILQGNNARVIRNNGLNLTTAALLDGFTVTGSAFGPAIDNFSSSPMLANVIITGNYSGGAVSNQGSSPVLINCAIIDNASPANGAAIYNSISSPVLINCTIAGNTNSAAGIGAIYNTNSSSAKIRNSIVYGNEGGIVNESGSSTDIQYSLVQGSASDPANHNISGDADPLFEDAANGNYQLKLCSPALNKASNGFYASGQTPDVSAVTTDLLGSPRFYSNGVTDMGTYEYQGNPPPVGVAGVSYIKAGATGSGASWDCAAGNVQVAINSATAGQQVWVARGTYQPAGGGSYSMKEGVKIYGGFTGTEASLTERNLTITSNKSTLQTNGASVLINSGLTLTSAAVLDGFIITGATNAPAIQNLSGASPMLVNLVVMDNHSFGGIYISASSPALINCTFTGNSSTSDGGGVLISGGSPTLTNCLISNNTANNGGGILISNASVTLTNCTIVGNTATGQGGGICNYSSLSSKLRNSIVYGNNIENFNNATLAIQYSLVQGENSTNNHNIAGTTDPLFVGAGNYRLQPCSPLVNKGYNFFASGQIPDLTGITTDLDSKPRIRENLVDMGAYEFGGTSRELAVDGNEASATVSGDLILTTNGSNCKILAYLSPNGGAPVNGSVTAKVWVANAQPVNFLKRHYQITPATNAANASARVTLYFTQQEFTDFNVGNSTKLPVNAADTENYKANLHIEKRSGASSDGSGLPGSYTGAIVTFKPSDANGNVVWNADANRWEVSFDVTGFSGFFIKTIESALPLRLISFTASKETGSNLLQWSTASEVNTDYFEVQSSVNAKSFGKIALVSAAGSGDHRYSYNDRAGYSGTIYYRLKMSDRDGTFTFSKIISLKSVQELAGIYPNPAGESVTLQVNDVLLKSTAILYDLSGRQIQSIVIISKQQQINTRSLASGLYFLKFADGTAKRFVKD